MKRALAQVNRARQALGMKPLKAFPRGIQRYHNACPVARALRFASVGYVLARFVDPLHAEKVARSWCTQPTWSCVELPTVLQRFIRNFDAGCYPELVTR